MPEGPEVRIFVDKLNALYKNKKIKEVKVVSGRYIKKPINNLSSLKDKIIKNFSCKGKFIWIDLDNVIIFNTLGMTGSWSKNQKKHSRIKITFTDNESLFFSDIRNFGTFQIKSRIDLAKKLKSIGPDMLSDPPINFISRLRKYNHKNICSVIMNQNVISGVGNYIKAESLWYSRINPHATVKDLSDDHLELLKKAIIYVINKSYQSQGATIQSYYDFEGNSGSATNSFVVYGKNVDYNGHAVLKEKTLDKRTTHWVKARQIYGLKSI